MDLLDQFANKNSENQTQNFIGSNFENKPRCSPRVWKTNLLNEYWASVFTHFAREPLCKYVCSLYVSLMFNLHPLQSAPRFAVEQIDGS